MNYAILIILKGGPCVICIGIGVTNEYHEMMDLINSVLKWMVMNFERCLQLSS